MKGRLCMLVGCAAAVLAIAPGRTARAVSPVWVQVVPIDGTIDLGLAPFVIRAVDEAAASQAAAVVFEINTLGGRVDAAFLIRDALLEATVPTLAFVNKRAISAGALIALGAETIAMADGATIGAATRSGSAARAPGRWARRRSPTCARSSARRRKAAVGLRSSRKPWSTRMS